MSARLSKSRKAELAPQAVEMSARGMSYRAIARELQVHYNTVTKLIDDELASRAEWRANDKERHLAVYDRVQRAAWERFDNTDNRSLNASGYLNTVLSAEQAKVKLTGAESPKKNEHTGPDGGPIEVADARDELRERLARFEISEPAE